MTDPRDIALPQPARIGQGTAIEQSRAVAEVYAAIMVARQVPRNTHAALAAMKEACETKELADRAFFSFPRGGQTVAGPSVHLAREIARCWGNIQYGVSELRRDDEHGQSEMQAFAWDLESNARSATIFIVPHKRDKRGGPEKLTDMRDIYENNANAGARRVRECIFSVLPIWYVEKAKAICTVTLQTGGGKPMDQQIADCIAAFKPVGVTVADLERKAGRASSEWTPLELGQFRVLHGSLSRNEITREEAFPTPVVEAKEVRAAAAAAKQAGAPAPANSDEEKEVDWHAQGHPVEDRARRVWEVDCPLCPQDDEALRTHYYGHTKDWVEGCGPCATEKQWHDTDREANGG